MSQIKILTLLILAFMLGSTSFAAEEIYLTDAQGTPGKIFQILADMPGRPGPFLWPKYFRRSGNIHAVAFPGYGQAYFTDANKYNIYKTDGVTENRIFTHSTYVRDLAFDSRNRLYFSEASGAGGNGVIYRLDLRTGRATRFVTVPLNAVGGFWAGNFAFDSANRLFISSGNKTHASIYEYVGGHFRQRFTHSEPITGFAFVNNRTLYFTNHRQKLYKLRNFRHLSVEYEESSSKWLNDVAFVRVPERGSCQLSGRVRGGEELWPVTFIEAYGPNVMWRRSTSATRVRSDGTYSYRDLPVGRYRVKTDIHAGTPVGFEPESHSVYCPETVRNVNFRYAR